MNSNAPRQPVVVLLCEDEPLIMMSTSALLEDHGMIVVEAASIADARAALDARSVSVIVTDVHLPDGSGITFATDIRANFSSPPIIFATGDRVVPEAASLSNTAVVGKPYADEELISLIREMAK
jgi:DNA-binding response OmpR family regulator